MPFIECLMKFLIRDLFLTLIHAGLAKEHIEQLDEWKNLLEL